MPEKMAWNARSRFPLGFRLQRCTNPLAGWPGCYEMDRAETSFDREIHENEHLSPTRKFRCLLASIKQKGRTAEVVRNHRGVPDGYEQAYAYLSKRISASKGSCENHVRAFRDLQGEFAVKTELDVSGREKLRKEVSSHLNALRFLKAPPHPSSYEVLAAVGIKESPLSRCSQGTSLTTTLQMTAEI